MNAVNEFKIKNVPRFYLLDYFRILLEAAQRNPERATAYRHFCQLKTINGLGDSRYRKVNNATSQSETRTRFLYTFNLVTDEAAEYQLIKATEDLIQPTARGLELLNAYKQGNQHAWKAQLIELMENEYGAFQYLVDLCYKFPNSLLLFPIYSPRKLHCNLNTTENLFAYIDRLAERTIYDCRRYMMNEVNLEVQVAELKNTILESQLAESKPSATIEKPRHNLIAKRIRDFWLKTFLRIYGYNYSLTSFDIWTYRAKQLDILNITEFYPRFSGRLVYPISVITARTDARDFKRAYEYPESGKVLYWHTPDQNSSLEDFINGLYTGYLDLRQSYRNTFVSISALREIVCFRMRISDSHFNRLLNIAHHLNMKNELRVRISLEVDRLPEETNLAYVKREPVEIDGKMRNIIALELKKGGSNE